MEEYYKDRSDIKVQGTHYYAGLLAIVIVSIVAIMFNNQTAPTAPEPLNERYYYDTEKFGILHKPVMVELDDLPFKHAFVMQREAKGSNAEFFWRGNYYTTNLAGEEMPKKDENLNIAYRYMVEFNINDERVSKFFDDELQAYTFAEMVEGTVVKFSQARYN